LRNGWQSKECSSNDNRSDAFHCQLLLLFRASKLSNQNRAYVSSFLHVGFAFVANVIRPLSASTLEQGRGSGKLETQCSTMPHEVLRTLGTDAQTFGSSGFVIYRTAAGNRPPTLKSTIAAVHGSHLGRFH
jgi:hypothetical protein